MTAEDILNHVRRTDYRPGKIRELARQMGVPEADYRAFRQQVKALEQEGALVRLRQNRYAIPDQQGLVVGQLKYHPRGFGLVSYPEGKADIFVRQRHLGAGQDGDLVQVELLEAEGARGLPEGRVVQVVKQPDKILLGTFYRRGHMAVVRPDEGRDRQDIFVVGTLPTGLDVGDKVVIKRAAGPQREGAIIEVLGDPQTPQLDYLQIYQSYDLPFAFPPEVDDEVAAVQLAIDEVLPDRRDLRALTAFTIDPLTARDFDDAISIQALAHGGYALGVHIADVSHYVPVGSAIDQEAMHRGTSVYLVDRVIPMLPERLSADICTLMPAADRLAFSVLMEFDRVGRRTGYELVPSVIHSRARLTYDQAQAVFDGQPAGPAQALADELILVKELAEKLHALRQERGAIDFDLAEPRVDMDEAGRVLGLGVNARFASNRLIEACMLAANEAVGDFALLHELPVLYRVHLPPDQEKISHFNAYMAALGLRVPTNQTVDPKALQGILHDISARPDAELIHKLLLRAMMRAEYAAQPLGHFGLACDHYLHFTSPIRRYPDLWVHRVLKAFLAGDLDSLLLFDRGTTELGRLNSAAERRATEAERTYIRTKQLRYMEERLGEEYYGKVSGMVPSGFFVELEGLMVDGFCPLATMDDYYRFYADRWRLVGAGSGRVIEMGMRVRVRLAAVDPLRQRMDLFFLEDAGAPGQKKTGKAGKPKRRKRLTRRRR